MKRPSRPEAPRALTNGLCGTAHVQVVTVAYCLILYYFPIFHIHLCYSPQKCMLQINDLFCFEINIYLRVSVIVMRSEQFAKLLTQCHPRTQT